VPFVQLDPDYECYSSCLVWGDPYIQQLSGERARINENSFVVYENRDVAIQADMEAYNSTQVVTFKQTGEQAKFVLATDCVGRSNSYVLFNATVGSFFLELALPVPGMSRARMHYAKDSPLGLVGKGCS